MEVRGFFLIHRGQAKPQTSKTEVRYLARFISYAIAKLATGRGRECPVLTYIFAALFVVQFIVTQG